MATEQTNKGTIFCTKEQFDTLMSTGSVTIDGTTYTYEDGFIYAVVDKDYVDLTSDQTIEGSKTFKMTDSAYVKLDDEGTPALYIQDGPQSVIINKLRITRDGVTYYYPNNAGTLATTDDVKKYRHFINIIDTERNQIYLILYSSSSSPVNTEGKLASIIDSIQLGNQFIFPACIITVGNPQPCCLIARHFHDTLSLTYSTSTQSGSITILECSDVVTEI